MKTKAQLGNLSTTCGGTFIPLFQVKPSGAKGGSMMNWTHMQKSLKWQPQPWMHDLFLSHDANFVVSLWISRTWWWWSIWLRAVRCAIRYLKSICTAFSCFFKEKEAGMQRCYFFPPKICPSVQDLLKNKTALFRKGRVTELEIWK